MSDDAAGERQAWLRLHAEAAGRLEQETRALFGRLREALAREPEERAFRPAPGCWSTDEVLAHVALANRYLLVLARKIVATGDRRLARGAACPGGPPGPSVPREVATDRRSWTRPDHMAPDESALAATGTELAREEGEILELLAACAAGRGSLHGIRNSLLPPGRDRLDATGWIDFLLRHVERHLAQIERNRRSFAPAP